MRRSEPSPRLSASGDRSADLATDESASREVWLVEEFAASLVSLAASSVEVYKRDLIAFTTWSFDEGRSGPAEIDRRLLRRYLAHLDRERLARRTIARKASVLRRYFAWLVRTSQLSTDPAAALSAPRGEARLPRVLREDELTQLIDGTALRAGGDDEIRRLRDDAVVELLYGSGLRVSELCSLSRDSLDLDRRRVQVVGKGNKERVVPLSPPAADALRRYFDHPACPAQRGSDQRQRRPAFANLRGRPLTPRDVRRILDHRSMVPTHPHALRHTFATRSFGWRCRSSCCARTSGPR